MSIADLPIPVAIIPPQPYLRHPLENFSRSTKKWRYNELGHIEEVDIDQPSFNFDPDTGLYLGRQIEEGATQFLQNSDSPAGEAVSLDAGTYTVWMLGSGSLDVTGDTTATVTQGAHHTFTLAAAGNVTIAPSGSVEFYQLEDTPFPTSPMVSGSTTFTRSADVATVTDLSWYNQSEGTFVAETQSVSTADSYVFEVGVDADSRISLKYDSGDFRAIIFNGGVKQMDERYSGIAQNTPYKVAFGYKDNDSALIVDGGAAIEDTTVDVPSSLEKLFIGNLYDGTRNINGHIRSLHYYPRRLTNTQDQFLTS